MKASYLVTVLLVGTLVLSACNLSGGAPDQASDPNAVATAIALTMQAAQIQTMSAQLTAGIPTTTPTVTPVSAPASGSGGSVGPVVVPPAAANSNSNCADSAKLTSEDPLDGAVYKPNTGFRKTWTLTNTGTCTWNSSYQFIFVNGTQMAVAAQIKPLVSNTVVPGGLLPIYIDMQSPSKVGDYSGSWSWVNGAGKAVPVSFTGGTSQVVTVKIKTQDAAAAVAPTFTFTPVPATATSIPAPSVYKPSADCANEKALLVNDFASVSWDMEPTASFGDGSACRIYGGGTGDAFWGQYRNDILSSISQTLSSIGYTGDSQYGGQFGGFGFRKGGSVAEVLVYASFDCPADPNMDPLACEDTVPADVRFYSVEVFMATK